MILQALTEQYEALAEQGKLARPGWSDAKVTFALAINDGGELTQVLSLKTEQTRGKKTVLVPQSMSLPAAPNGRTSTSVKPAFLWDNPKYILGISKEGVAPQNRKYFEGSKKLHHRLLDGVDSPAAKALLAFFDHWEPGRAAQHPAFSRDWEELISGANLVFWYQGTYVQEDPLIRQAWQDCYNSAGDGPELVCLVTGQKGPAEAVHPSVKGLAGAQSSGAALVSFNAPAFCSYGREQNLNAPVGKYAAFAYTAALNYMLADREHLIRIGDTTVLFWAKDGKSAYQDLFSAFALGGTGKYDAGNLLNVVNALFRGEKPNFDEARLDPNMDFYVLGLAPNAARLSVRFFLKNSFGEFMKNIQEHYKRLYIVRTARDKFDIIHIPTLLDDVVNQNSATKLYDKLFGETINAILTNTQYPATLRNFAYLRIHADRDITRSQASILKANLLKKYEQLPEKADILEVLQMDLNESCTYLPYLLGRLFSVMEQIQLASADWKINRTIKDSYFTSVSATPKNIFAKLFPLSEYHMRKLKRDKFNLARKLEDEKNSIIAMLISPIPTRFTPDEVDCFYIGYYHQSCKKESDKKLKEET